MTFPTTPDASPASAPAPRATGTVVAFPPASARRFRREALQPGEPRGEVLLFTGIRYEHLTDAAEFSGSAPKRQRS